MMLGHPTPILRSFDEKRAKDFYLHFLGFELVFEHRFEEWAPLYMSVKKGDCVLHLSEHYGDGCPGAALRIPVDDVNPTWPSFAPRSSAIRAPANRSCSPGDHGRSPSPILQATA